MPQTTSHRVSVAEAVDRLAFAAAALGAAGHAVTDPGLVELTEQFARGEISLEEAGRRGDQLIVGR